MADILGCMAMSHGPQLLTPSEKWPDLPTRVTAPFNPKPGIELELTPEFMAENSKRCDAALATLRHKLVEWSPDTIIIVGDDQNENLKRDNMPPFTIFLSDEVDATLRYRYWGEKETDQMTRYQVDSSLANVLIEELMTSGFDPSWSRETRYPAGLGHAFGRVLKFILPNSDIPIVPIMVNTYYPPAPKARRCFEFGEALGKIISNSSEGKNIAVVASGGLSHTKIDEKLDEEFLTALKTNNRDYLCSMSSEILVSGTSEILNWIVVAGVAGIKSTIVDYAPCYRNADGVGCAMGFAYWDKTS
tara:strand:+ start:413 stop:1321 length:909 start_codon:yes stop_codon:yes gene_type:complete